MKSKRNRLIEKAISLHQSGLLDEAEKKYKNLLAHFPSNVILLTNLGTIYLQKGKYEQCLSLIQKSLRIDSNQPDAHNNLAFAHHRLNQFDLAIESCNSAIAIDQNYAQAYYNKGNSLQALNHHDDAIKCYDNAIANNPQYAPAYSNRGISLQALNRSLDAIESYNSAIAIDQNYAQAYYNKGNSLQELNRNEEALASYDNAIAINSEYPQAYLNRGLTLKSLKRLNEAIISYDNAISINSDYAEAYWNKSLVNLLMGNYVDGLRLYEWRWKKDTSNLPRVFEKPLWLGEQCINNKSILIYPEQGLGDFIQCMRYCPLIEKMGASVILEVPLVLMSIVKPLGNFTIIEKGQSLPDFDFHCPIFSLPLAFKTTIESIPNQLPYVSTDIVKGQLWKDKIGIKKNIRVGLVWSGSVHHTNDFNRSIPIEKFISLLDLPIDFYCLQKDIRNDDLTILTSTNIKNYSYLFNDFSDTAALIEQMDIVISVDTSVAHLAGAMGKTVWILLPYMPDYRWMLDRSDTPWYPTAKLFRQKEIGNWKTVINEVFSNLNEKCQCYSNVLKIARE